MKTHDMSLSERIKMKGLELGFSHVGIIPCHDFDDYAAEVASRPGYEYFVEKEGSFYEGCFPSRFFPQGKSIVCATFGYSDIAYPEELLEHVGRIYLARCYVPVPENMAGRRLTAMTEFLEENGMEVYQGKIEVPARPAAIEAGIVGYGNNNFVYTEEDGSFIVVYTWLVDAELDYDERPASYPVNECPPLCHFCIEACPTGAITAMRTLDPMRCILMNDLRPENAPAMEDLMGGHIHGCDICQTVCPRNHSVLAHATRHDPFLDELAGRFDLERILLMESFEDPYYRDVVYPIMYNYIRDIDVFRKNAAIALGNSGDAAHIPALREATERFADLPSGRTALRAIEKLEALEA